MSGLGNRSRRGVPIVAALLAALPAYAFATADPADPDDRAALAELETGRWAVRDLDAGVEREAVCIGDPLLLARLEHAGASCTTEVLASGPKRAIVQYTCPGHGFGHSTLKVETPRLARIDSQGISDNRPFAFRAEARRTGPC
jgi:hypothetical protein